MMSEATHCSVDPSDPEAHPDSKPPGMPHSTSISLA
jgi:hypothetical protein